MSDTWKKFDLEGAGLQSLNLHLARTLRKPRVAYLLWLLFPVGAHRAYLHERWGNLAYVVLTALTLSLGIALESAYWLIPAVAEGVFALFDLLWIDRRVVAINKQLRMSLYLGTKATPPSGYRGRYTDEEPESLLQEYVRTKEREKGGHQAAGGGRRDTESGTGKRIPSFADQERMLRELAKARRRESDEPGNDR
ncbi:MAG: TM2 domain-containing protein [Gammaproteobacteria bacterium]